jgi:4'-phosphopantetheinyl transferase
MSGERIDLYFGLLDEVDQPEAYEACFATLSLKQKRRVERFVFERHRGQYIFAHGLLRVALSSFVPEVEPSVPRMQSQRDETLFSPSGR